MRLFKAAPEQPAERIDMQLLNPSNQWRSAFLEMVSEYEAVGEHRYALALRDFDGYLQRIEDDRRGENLPSGWVPSIESWLEHDGKIIARGKLRLALTPNLENEGGHIGYDVRPSMRRLGHGTELLRLMLVEARTLGIDRVRIMRPSPTPWRQSLQPAYSGCRGARHPTRRTRFGSLVPPRLCLRSNCYA